MKKLQASKAKLLKDQTTVSQNKKKMADDNDMTNRSLLKKNELSLVFLGAAVITIIAVLFFLGSSGNSDGDNGTPENVARAIQGIEERLTRLEEMVQAIDMAGSGLGGEGITPSADIKNYSERVERVETALSVKFDVMTARVDNIEKKIEAMGKRIAKGASAMGSQQNRDLKTSSSISTKKESASTNTSVSANKTVKPSLPAVKKATKTVKTASASTGSSNDRGENPGKPTSEKKVATPTVSTEPNTASSGTTRPSSSGPPSITPFPRVTPSTTSAESTIPRCRI